MRIARPGAGVHAELRVTLAQRELLAAAHKAIAVLQQVGPKVHGSARAKKDLQVAIMRVELEDRAALPSIDAPSLLRRQAE